MSDTKGCKYGGCERAHLARGYCRTHYRQVLVGTELRPLREYKKQEGYENGSPDYCTFEDCERAYFAGGYCGAHYSQNRRGKELGPVRFRARKNKEKELTEVPQGE